MFVHGDNKMFKNMQKAVEKPLFRTVGDPNFQDRKVWDCMSVYIAWLSSSRSTTCLDDLIGMRQVLESNIHLNDAGDGSFWSLMVASSVDSSQPFSFWRFHSYRRVKREHQSFRFVATGTLQGFASYVLQISRVLDVFRLLCHGVNMDSTIGSQLGIAAASVCANSPVLVESLTITFSLDFAERLCGMCSLHQTVVVMFLLRSGDAATERSKL
ncbi:Uncharacterized protein Rs2_09472 [Raphanus sativus]|nr:Uncharacterized protein Rs2_09472 [Raphanus sativus]